jgi:DNA topoisomerase-1
MDYHFTANIEAEFDKVAEGKKQWNSMVRDFYDPFHKEVEETMETATRATGERMLGEHPESRRPVFAKMGRFGAMVQIGSADDEEKPLFASLRPGQSIETISLEEALALFKLPFSLGDHNGKEVSVGVGRFGPYVKYGDDFISLPKGEDPLAVDMARAQAIIADKQQADAPIATYEGQPVTKGKGRFGPFIKWGDLYINVPRRFNFDALTQSDCDELIAAKLDKEANRYIQQWPELKISIENGRWGPYVRFGKKMLKLGKPGKSKFTQEEAAALTLDEVKEIIVAQVPGAFDKKAGAGNGAAAKKAAPKKAAAKKASARKK